MASSLTAMLLSRAGQSHHDAAMVLDIPGTPPVPLTWSPGLNSDMTAHIEHTKFSYTQAAARCAAMQKTIEHNGRDTSEPAWFLMARTGIASVEGPAFVHQSSAGHPGYDYAATEKKMQRANAGPAGCETWESTFGAGGPCDSILLKPKPADPP